jgi:hypothetical protein
LEDLHYLGERRPGRTQRTRASARPATRCDSLPAGFLRQISL